MSSRKKRAASDEDDGLDEELLALAEKKKPDAKKRRRGSDSDEPKAAPKKKAPAPRKKRKRDSDESSEESSEVSSTSSDESSSSSESDFDSQEEFRDEWGEDGMGDDDDRRKLAAMPEREREKIIFKRMEEREHRKEMFEIRRQKRLAKRAEKRKAGGKAKGKTAPAKKRGAADKGKAPKAAARKGGARQAKKKKDASSSEEVSSTSDSSTSDDDEEYAGGRRTTRSSKRLAEAVESQGDRTPRDRRVSADIMRLKRANSERDAEIFGSDEDVSDAGSDKDRGKSGPVSHSRAPVSSGLRERSYKATSDDRRSREGDKNDATLAEMHKVQLPRSQLRNWVHYDFFEEYVTGMFVRVHIGADKQRIDPATRMPARVYRIAEIVRVEKDPKGVSYEFEGTRTDRYLVLRVGESERRFQARLVSNDRFTESEFSAFKKLESKFNARVPSSGEIADLSKRLATQLEYRPSEDEFSAMLASKRRLNPTMPTVMERDRIQREISLKEASEDSFGIDELRAKLEEVDRELKRIHERRNEELSVIDRINERNRRKNVVDVHNAFVEAWKRDVGSGNTSDGHESGTDPFERRKCRPLLVRHTNSPAKKKAEGHGEGVDSGAEANGESASHGDAKPSEPSAPPAQGATPGGKAPAAKQGTADDPFAAHDFDLDIDLGLGSGHDESASGHGTTGQQPDAARRVALARRV